MVIAKFLSPYHAVQVRLHEFLDEVNLFEIVETGGSQDVENRDDVLVMEVTQQLYLAQCSQAEHRVIKGGDTLDRNLPLGGYVYGGTAHGHELEYTTNGGQSTHQTMPYAPSPITSKT